MVLDDDEADEAANGGKIICPVTDDSELFVCRPGNFVAPVVGGIFNASINFASSQFFVLRTFNFGDDDFLCVFLLMFSFC